MAKFSEKARPKGIKVDQDKLVKQVLDDLKDDEKALSDWKAEAEESWQNYYSQVTEEVKEYPWPGAANYFVPATAIMCDALMAMMFSRFHLPKPFLSIKPTTEDMVDRAKTVEHLLNFQFREELKIPYEIDGWALDTLVEGVKVIMPHWSVDKKIIRHPRTISVPVQIQNPSTGEFITQMEEREIFDETEDRTEAPAVTVPDSEDFLYPPILKDLQSCSHVIRIVYKTWEEILEGKDDKLYYNINDDLKDALMENFLDNKTIQEVKSGRIGVEQALDRKVIRIIEWYGRWDMGKGRRNEEVFVAVVDHSKSSTERGTIIRGPIYLTELYRHGLRPFIGLRAIKHGAGRFQGQSVPQKIKQTQEELNAMHNQRVDFGTLRNMPWILTGATVQPQDIILQPGAIVGFPGAENSKFPNFQGNPVFEQNEEIGLFQYLERTLPVTDLRLGRSPSVVGPSSTATGMMNLMRQSDIRLQPILANFEAGMKELVRHIYALDVQYLPPEKKFRLEGEEGEDVFIKIDSREEISGKFDFIVDLGSEDAQVERQLALLRYQIMSQHPLMAQNPIAQYELLKDLATNLGRTDIDKFIPKPPKELRRSPLDPADEHQRMASGEYLSPLPHENHVYHLSRHGLMAGDAKWQALPDNIEQLLALHMNEHNYYILRELQLQRQMGGVNLPLATGGSQTNFTPSSLGGTTSGNPLTGGGGNNEGGGSPVSTQAGGRGIPI